MIHITRASSQGVCHCSCPDSLMSVPDQLDCPWCGCGWLFTCHRCGKGFTFGKAVRSDMKLRDFVLKDFRQRDVPQELLQDKDFIDGCVESIAEMFEQVEVGKEYVYFDGILIPTDFDGPIEFEGLFAAHELQTLPHLELRDDPDAAKHILGDPRYWTDRELPPLDDEDEEGEEFDDDEELDEEDVEDDGDDDADDEANDADGGGRAGRR